MALSKNPPAWSFKSIETSISPVRLERLSSPARTLQVPYWIEMRWELCDQTRKTESPVGLRWTELRKRLEAPDDAFHPKTVNGYVWK